MTAATRTLGAALCAIAVAACGQLVGIDEIVPAPCEPNEPIDFATIDLPSRSAAQLEGIMAVDLNVDGRLDLVVRRRDSSGTSSTSILVDITPAGEQLPSYAPEVPLVDGGAHVADFNDDGLLDLITPCGSTNCVAIYLSRTAVGAPSISLAAPIYFDQFGSSRELAVGDLTGDGKPDFLVWRPGAATGGAIYMNTTSPGATTTSFSSLPINLSPGGSFPSTEHIDIVDLDGDGKADLLATVADEATPGTRLWVAHNTGATDSSRFGPMTEVARQGRRGRHLTTDVDGDGKPDLVVGADTTEQLWLNTTQPADQAPLFVAGPALECRGDPLAVYDIDSNGARDVVFAEPAGWVCVQLNTRAPGEPLSSAHVDVARTIYPALYGVPDVNHDGTPDMVAYGERAQLVLMASGSHCEPPT